MPHCISNSPIGPTRFNTFMAASLPDPAWGPGRLDAFGMIFNRVSGLDLQYPPNVTKADALRPLSIHLGRAAAGPYAMDGRRNRTAPTSAA